MIFLKQRKDDRIRDLNTRLKIKADSLINFINREIAPAYSSEPVIRADYEEVLKAIDQYRSEREAEIPNLSVEDLKRLVTLWTIAQREREGLVQLKNELLEQSKKTLMPHRSSLFFICYFMFELIFGFVALFLVLAEHDFQYIVTQLAVILAIIGLLPLGNLVYNIR